MAGDWFAFEPDARGKVTGVTPHGEGEALRNPRIGDAPAGRRGSRSTPDCKL